MASGSKDVYLVIGGSGFLGRHIVNALLARGDTVSVFDIVQRYHDVPFYTGDITEQDSISEALSKVRIGTMGFSKRLYSKTFSEWHNVYRPHRFPTSWAGRRCIVLEGQCRRHLSRDSRSNCQQGSQACLHKFCGYRFRRLQHHRRRRAFACPRESDGRVQ